MDDRQESLETTTGSGLVEAGARTAPAPARADASAVAETRHAAGPGSATEPDTRSLAGRSRDDPRAQAASTEDQTLSIGDLGDPGTEIEPGTPVGRRYVIREVLGKGGCAIVYLAHDPVLDRLVALKMPRSDGFRGEAELAAFVREARNAAQLDHPGVVRTYDVQSEPGSVFIVQQYIDGRSLSVRMKSGRVEPARAAEILAGVAEALGYAHRSGFVHRDIKPANILLDSRGRPFLGDFGLALHESAQRDHWGELAGTAPYMSPEQVRREVHRLDGRSDVWGLGVILYEMLTGSRPFASRGTTELFAEIQASDPRPPSEVDPSVPAELSRICLKCLAKRAADRYRTADELADDLRRWRDGDRQRPEAADAAGAKVVPRGLRSFGADDAGFFLELLPGPRDREGLPEGLHFWRRQLERTEPDPRLAACLMYGPSGSGKSSLVKAGLIPRLAPHVLPVYVEATAGTTEARLLRALREHDPAIPAETPLPEVFERIREARGIGGRKVLVILDQFEQWLHAAGGRDDGPMIRALRQADGGALQCLILVRDDFWMSVTRFLQGLEVPQIEGLNASAVDLFDVDHAKKVLRTFGRAYGALPEGGLAPEHREFLDRAVAGLAERGKVVTVRLALFAQMMKGRPWTPEALDDVGGTQGVDRAFLDESLSAPDAPPSRRRHEAAARAVLGALLPAPGSEIRGRMEPVGRLVEASGYDGRPDEFRELLEVLDGELRLITPAQPDGAEPGPTADGSRCYQLTHDFLVPALRGWLAARRRETPRGRAEIRLEERAALWAARPEPRQLPSFSEWAGIRALTDRSAWTGPQRRMMRAASRRHLARAGVVLAAIVLGVGAGVGARRAVVERERRGLARFQVQQLWDVGWPSLPRLLDGMADRPDLWRPEVAAVAASRDSPPGQRTRAALALARHDGAWSDGLVDRLLAADDPEQATIRAELRPRMARVAPKLWRHALDPGATGRTRLAAALALAGHAPDDPRWADLAGPVVRALLESDPLKVNPWVEALRPVRGPLKAPLIAGFADAPTAAAREMAAGILVDFAGEDPGYLDAEGLARLVLDAAPGQSAILAPLARRRGDALVGRLSSVVAARVRPEHDAENERAIRRQANAAEALRELGRDDEFWPRLRQSEDPRLRTRLIDRVAGGPDRWEALLDRVAREPDGTIRQAILIGLEPMKSGLPETDRRRAADRLLAIYENDPDPGAHAGAEWILNRWGFAEEIASARSRLVGPPRKGRGWYVTPHGFTMVLVPAPGKVRMGSPPYEPNRDAAETIREATIDHAFAISAHEVTFRQFLAFRPDTARDRYVSPNDDCPASYVTWFEAVRYCRWLSEQPDEETSEDQRPYPPIDEIGPSMRLPADYLRRHGYRLPTEEEWEYAARAGSMTAWFFGNAREDVGNYARYALNADERTWPVGGLRPSPLGLFDIYGNIHEFCDRGPLPGGRELAPQRGGCYRTTEKFLRSAMFEQTDPSGWYVCYGFRIVKVIAMP